MRRPPAQTVPQPGAAAAALRVEKRDRTGSESTPGRPSRCGRRPTRCGSRSCIWTRSRGRWRCRSARGRLSAGRRVHRRGVGALRRGEFSTGTALERVTEWGPPKVPFVVPMTCRRSRAQPLSTCACAPPRRLLQHDLYELRAFSAADGGPMWSTHLARAPAGARALLAADGALDVAREQRADVDVHSRPRRAQRARRELSNGKSAAPAERADRALSPTGLIPASFTILPR